MAYSRKQIFKGSKSIEEVFKKIRVLNIYYYYEKCKQFWTSESCIRENESFVKNVKELRS